MNLPNKLTILRVCLIPFFVLFFLWDAIPYHSYLAAAIFIIACLSDTLDGYIARKYNLITNFGKFMDPLADKVLVSAALVCFVETHLIPGWIVIVILSREFIISGFRLVASDNNVVIAASVWGKAKTIVQMIMCILLLFHFDFPWYTALEQISIYASLFLTIISLLDYIWKNKQVLKA